LNSKTQVSYMNEDHLLTDEEALRLHSTIQTVELTGDQLATLTNTIAFSLVHNDCLMKRNPYSAVYYDECKKLYEYINSYVSGIIGDNNDKKPKTKPTSQT
jgi:hypothetical protein